MMYSIPALPLLSLLSSITQILASDVWTVNCGVLSVQRSDPIVSPGVASGHVHAISGGTAFRRSMPGIDSAVDAKATTCDKYTDHSNYWCPQLYNRKDGMFELVPYTGANMYYKRFTCSYQAGVQYCPSPTDARPFPPGLRMIAGDPERRTQNNSDQTNQAIIFETGNSGEMYGFPKTLASNLQMNIRFPSCWDNKNLDSPDHKSHMAYPDPSKGDTQGGMCPESHPVALFHIGAEFGFDTGSLGIGDSLTLVFSMGDTTGYGGHGDFLQGWQNLAALGNSFNTCNGIGEACAWNSFGTPNGQMGTKSTLNPETPAVYEEQIGLNGPIPALPGNNPVYTPGASSLAATAIAVSTPLPTTLATVTKPTSAVSTKAGGVATSIHTTRTPVKPTTEPTSTSITHTGGDGNGDNGNGNDDAAEDDGHDACEL